MKHKALLLGICALFLLETADLNAQTISRSNSRKIATRIKEYRLKRGEALRKKDFEEAAKISWRIASNYIELNQLGLVEREYIKAIGFAEKANDQKLYGYAHERAGDALDNKKFHTKKMQYYQRAADIYKNNQFTDNYAEALQKMAKFSYEAKKYLPMTNAVEELLDNPEKYKLTHLEKEAYCKMMIEAFTENEDREAVKVYDQILEDLMKTPNREKIIATEAKKKENQEGVDLMLISNREVDILRKVKSGLQEEVAIKEDSMIRQNAYIQRQKDSIERQQMAIRLQEAKTEEEIAKGNLLLVGIAGTVIIAGVSGFAFLNKQKANKLLAQKNTEIEEQRQKSDALLLNILPEETANELKEKGKASPRSYEMVSVLFTDFKGFTNIASQMTPEKIIQELDRCFLAFDEIVEKHNLEKIKTIGDAYMCAGGIPVANTTNPIDTVAAALEMQEFMLKWQKEKQAKGEPYFELRVGVHTGKVVAGVVGNKKFAYDIWGDTVNVAARMESSGEPTKVNISGDTYNLVKDYFSTTYRGKVPAKNKGEIDMYFVEGRKS